MANSLLTSQPIEQSPKQSELHETLLTERKLQHALAWTLSFILHVLVLFTIAALAIFIPGGTGGKTDGKLDLGVVYEVDTVVEVNGDQFLTDESGGGASGGGSDATAAAIASSLPSSAAPPTGGDSLLVGLLPSNQPPSDGDGNAAGGLGLGNGGSALGSGGGSPKAKTKVFGVEGEGRRFVYVFDRSDSMNGYSGRPFAAARNELRRSIESLSDVHEFQIIFYNDEPFPFGGLDSNGPRMLFGNARNKEIANSFVRDMSATGGTQHLKALRMAINLHPM